LPTRSARLRSALHRGLKPLAALSAVLILAGCTDVHRTEPDRTANEQLLISKAADEAADQLDFTAVAGQRVYVDSSNFESLDKGYAISRIRTAILAHGGKLANERRGADLIAEISSGALSINRKSFLVGLPALELPVPTTESVALPEFAIFKQADRTGLAKFAATLYEADTGQLVANPDPAYGLSWLDRSSIFGIGWTDDNLLPPEVPDDPPPARRPKDAAGAGE
jgi:hypothetical protein